MGDCIDLTHPVWKHDCAVADRVKRLYAGEPETITPAMVERAARAMIAEQRPSLAWDDVVPSYQDEWRVLARAALTAAVTEEEA